MITISLFTKEKFSNNRVAKYLWLDLFNKGLVCCIKQKKFKTKESYENKDNKVTIICDKTFLIKVMSLYN